MIEANSLLEISNDVAGGKVRVTAGSHPHASHNIVTLRVPGAVWPGWLGPDEAEAIARALNAAASLVRDLDRQDNLK